MFAKDHRISSHLNPDSDSESTGRRATSRGIGCEGELRRQPPDRDRAVCRALTGQTEGAGCGGGSAAARAAFLLAARMRPAARFAPRLRGRGLSGLVIARSAPQGVLQPEQAAGRPELQDGVGRRSRCEDVPQRVHGTNVAFRDRPSTRRAANLTASAGRRKARMAKLPHARGRRSGSLSAVSGGLASRRCMPTESVRTKRSPTSPRPNCASSAARRPGATAS
jgi:hypothetical protein